jgi:serine/threonine protein kinase
MSWVALNCPQCSAPLPRVAIWRAVKCGSCGALITRTESTVSRESFRQALIRAQKSALGGSAAIECAGERYELLELLGTGELSKVYLARRAAAMPFLATLKLSSSPAAALRYAREAKVLRELQTLSPLFPEVVAEGPAAGGQHALVLDHPSGFWGSMSDLNERFPQGIDPRHAVWIWRRMVDILRFLHAQGWSHGDIRPEHALVHPQDHAVRLISWSSAQKNAHAQTADLMRSARTVLVLVSAAAGSVSSNVPAGLATLLTRASQDEAFCRTQTAQGLDDLIRAAASEAFGPPSFVALDI